MARTAARWWWHPRRILATMIVLFWGHMAAFPDGYTSGTYAVVAEVAPLRWWALAILTAGTAMLTTRPRELAPVVAVTALMCAWLTGTAAATITGDSQSPGGFLFVAGYVALLIWGAGRNLDPAA